MTPMSEIFGGHTGFAIAPVRRAYEDGREERVMVGYIHPPIDSAAFRSPDAIVKVHRTVAKACAGEVFDAIEYWIGDTCIARWA